MLYDALRALVSAAGARVRTMCPVPRLVKTPGRTAREARRTLAGHTCVWTGAYENYASCVQPHLANLARSLHTHTQIHIHTHDRKVGNALLHTAHEPAPYTLQPLS